MGVSYYVFIGPFIEAPDAEKPTNVKYMGCGTQGCEKKNKESTDKFCPKCGFPIKQCEKTSVVKASRHFDSYEEFDDRLNHIHHENLPEEKQDSAIFQPNQGNFGQRFFAYDCSVVELNETVMADELARFKTVFAKDIARIKEVFGEAEVKWGAIAYVS